MKHSLMDEYRRADLEGKKILQATIDELCKIQAKGRTFIRIKELLEEAPLPTTKAKKVKE